MNQFKEVVFTIFLLIAVCHLTAQETAAKDTVCPSWYYRNDIIPEHFESGFQTAIFGDRVNVRQSPSKSGDILEALPIGQPVQVIAFDTSRLTINGRTACWHLIAWPDTEKRQKQGWVLGG